MSNKAQPLASRHRALLPTRGFAQYFSGGPSLLISAGFASAVSDFGFDMIFALVGQDDIRLFRDSEASGADDFVEMSALPSGLLAIVAMTDDAAALRALWTDRGQEPPPVIVVENALQALGPVLAHAQAEIATVSNRCAELQRALVATRAEFEETRSAMQGVMRTLSHRYATKMNLVATTAPSRDRTVTLTPGDALQRVYSVGTEAVTCIALHIAAFENVPNAVLAVKLRGVESGRVLGEWRRPGKLLFEGWNCFDFPTPIASARETLAIDLDLQGTKGSAITLSLSDEDLFAIRIWTADPGGRFPHAEHWVWNTHGETRPGAGTVSLVGLDTLARIVARGNIEGARDGASSRYLLRGGSSLLTLPELSIQGAEAILVELKLGFGDLRNTRFELAVQSAGHCFASGWQSFGDDGSALNLGLSLSAALPDVVDLYLRIEDGERAVKALAGFFLHQIEIVSGARSELEMAVAQRIYPEAWPLAKADPGGPSFAALKASNYNETEKFAWFDVVIEGLQFDGRVESRLKFKISMGQGRLSLEFRRGPNWPAIFKDWPGREQDRFGEVFRIADIGGRLAVAGELTPGSDYELSATLCRLMPVIVAAGVRAFPGAQGRAAAWLETASAFAAAADDVFDGLAR